MYAVGLCQLARADFGLMKHTLEHQLQLPLNTKQQWVASINAALHQRHLQHGAVIAKQELMETRVIRNPI